MKIIAAVFAAVVLFVACENSNSPKSEAKADALGLNKKDFPSVAQLQSENESITDSKNQEEEKPQQPGRLKSQNQTQQPIFVSKQDWDKKIIKTASLNLETKDFENFNSSLREKVKQVGGYVAQEEQSESVYKIENRLTLKVPVDQFEYAVSLLIANVDKLNEKKITSQDVTTEFVDTKSRIESKKQVRLRYLDLLKQAKNMEEILNVQSEINDVQEEIESASGRIEYLSHSSSFSTINLTFYQILNEAAIDPDKPSFATKIKAAFGNGWTWVGEVFVGLISIWPLLILAFTGFILYKRVRKEKPKPIQG